MKPRWLAVCFIMALCVSPASAQLEVLKKKSCDLPPALRGVTGHVLMRYHVNLQGHVVFTEPAFSQVRPPDRKQALEQHLKDCLGQWTYRPSEEKASWARSYLELLLAFHYFPPADDSGPTSRLPDGRQVPRSILQEMRATKLELADQLMKGPDFVEEKGDSWLLRTNVKRADRAGLVDSIRAAQAAFDQVFPGAPPGPDGPPVIVLLFGSQDQFNKISAFDNLFARPRLGGQYVPEEGIAYTFAARQDAPLKLSHDYLRHEVTHHLIWRRLCSGARHGPGWVNEGIATFIELLRPARKQPVDRFRFLRGRQSEGGRYWTARSETYLDAFDLNDRKGALPDIEAFLRGDELTMDVDLAYGLSWIITHYLIHGEDGAFYPPFLAWMLGPMGTPQDPGLISAIGWKPDQILPALREHARLMRQRG